VPPFLLSQFQGKTMSNPIEFTKPGAREIATDVPPERSCASCMFMQKQRVAPTDLRIHMFCYRLPPTPVAVPSPQGLNVNSMHTPVQAHEWCYEYRPLVSAANN
jgi:hypothetical protein